MTERDKIKERIAKLLNMTRDRGATEAEALAAAEKAGELMTHYDIAASQLDIRASKAIKQTIAIRKYGNMNIAAPVAHHVAQFCDCMYWQSAEVDPRDIDLPEVWQRTVNSIVFFGLPADAEIAGYLFELISNAIIAEIDVYKASPDYQREVETGANGRSAITSFVDGMEKTICDRLDAMRDEKHQAVQEATGRELVVVKETQIKEDFEATGIKLVRGGGPIVGRVRPAPMQAGGQQAAEFLSLLVLGPDDRLEH